jgi:predicted RNase H-like nuclease
MMTPWFELQRHVRQRQRQRGEVSRVGQLLRAQRRPRPALGSDQPGVLQSAYFAVWWWRRPRDRAVYVIEDHRHRLGVMRG